MTVYKQSNGKNWWYKFTWNGKTVRGLRILIVDDFEVNRQVLHEQVFSWGMRLMEAIPRLRKPLTRSVRRRPWEILSIW